MSQSVNKAAVEKRSKTSVWFNNLFRTKLEVESDKLLEMMQASNENQINASAQYFYKRERLEKGVTAKLAGPPRFVKLTGLAVTYWCDVPKGLWKKFNADAVFAQQLQDHVNSLTDRLIGEWAERQIHWERIAVEADKTGNRAGVDTAKAEFEKDCVTLQKECETVAIEDIAEFFTAKAASFANYKRYRFKAGAKLTFTFVSIAISIAALSTAATPAGPATLVPALIGLVASVSSAAKQIYDLSSSAEEIAGEIRDGAANMSATYKDKKGNPKKKTFAAKDFTSGFASGLTGGWSDVVFPSINSLMGLTGMHLSKMEGLEVSLSGMGTALNALVTALDAADKVLEDNMAALKEARKNPKPGLDKVEAGLIKSKAAFLKMRKEFISSFEKDIPAMIKRVEKGLADNKLFKQTLTAINEAVGSKNWGLAGNLFATVALTAIGFSGGAPANLAETVTIGMGPGFTALDTLREYTPELMEKVGIIK